jgi:hypothetical protein
MPHRHGGTIEIGIPDTDEEGGGPDGPAQRLTSVAKITVSG